VIACRREVVEFRQCSDGLIGAVRVLLRCQKERIDATAVEVGCSCVCDAAVAVVDRGGSRSGSRWCWSWDAVEVPQKEEKKKPKLRHLSPSLFSTPCCLDVGQSLPLYSLTRKLRCQ
jgi:hypothetical protein